jgi:hypothetical protein
MQFPVYMSVTHEGKVSGTVNPAAHTSTEMLGSEANVVSLGLILNSKSTQVPYRNGLDE